jgi:hypothetical protein
MDKDSIDCTWEEALKGKMSVFGIVPMSILDEDEGCLEGIEPTNEDIA